MRHQDQGSDAGERTNADDLFRVLQWVTAHITWSRITCCAERVAAARLACAALLWAWSDERTLIDRFRTARKIIGRWGGEQEQPAASYQAFIKLLRRWTGPLRELLTEAFRERTKQSLDRVWKVAGWWVLAVHGSKIDVPRMRRNEQRHSPRSKLSRCAKAASRLCAKHRAEQASRHARPTFRGSG